jgi:hypothetical protein
MYETLENLRERRTKTNTYTSKENTIIYNALIVTDRIYIVIDSTMYILPVTSLSLLKKWRRAGDLK